MAKIAVDIDSTLHDYWDLLATVARTRFGVDLPYEAQLGWGIAALDGDQLAQCIAETHSEENVLAAEPYPDAVDTLREWHHAGHWIHITSHRAIGAAGATRAWLERIGAPYDDLHCSYDKIRRCAELRIDVLIDDSPLNIVSAVERGMLAATVTHPWNAELVRNGTAIGAGDWLELRRNLEPHLADVSRRGSYRVVARPRWGLTQSRDGR